MSFKIATKYNMIQLQIPRMLDENFIDLDISKFYLTIKICKILEL